MGGRNGLLDRIRDAARRKIVGAVAEVAERQEHAAAQRHHEVLGRLDALAARLCELEHRTRRDLHSGQDLLAVAESAAFATEHMPTTPRFGHPHDTLRHALDLTSTDGMALEFGVAGGTTLQIIADRLGGAEPAGGRLVAGFDVFTGLPEDWRTGFAAGEFAQRGLPTVPGARLVPGLFADTLPGFLAQNPGPVAFLHLDADLYSSTKTVLDLLGDRLVPGSVVVFDEYFNYPGWRRHEYQAWAEFVAQTGTQFDYAGYSADNEQVIVVVR